MIHIDCIYSILKRKKQSEHKFITDEDPVTGSAHCTLGPFWQSKLGKSVFTAYQASHRGGVVRVALEGSKVLLGGQAVTVWEGNVCSAVISFSQRKV